MVAYIKKDDSENEYQWFLKLSRKLSAEKDKKYVDLLQSLQDLIGDKIKSFDDLKKVPSTVFIEKMEAFCKLLNSYNMKAGSDYALNKILEERNDLTYFHYCDLFMLLDRSSRDYPYMRGDVANYIIDKLDKSHSEHFLNFLDNLKDDGIDRFVLLLGLKKVDKKYRPRVIELLRRDAVRITNIDPASETARRIKAVELLPEFKKILPKIKNGEVRREVQKTIDSLEKHKGKTITR